MTAPVVVSDMDGTLATVDTWRGVQAWIREHHPSPAARRFVTVRLPRVVLAKAGLLDKEAFRARWLADQARLLADCPAGRLDEMAEWVVEHHLWPARRQVASMPCGGHGHGEGGGPGFPAVARDGRVPADWARRSGGGSGRTWRSGRHWRSATVATGDAGPTSRRARRRRQRCSRRQAEARSSPRSGTRLRTSRCSGSSACRRGGPGRRAPPRGHSPAAGRSWRARQWTPGIAPHDRT